jgi:hypothetical protein
VELFQVETDGLDNEIIRAETSAQNLRSRIKIYGDARVEFVEKPDFEGLQAKKKQVEAELEEQKAAIKPENEAILAKHEADQRRAYTEVTDFNNEQKLKDSAIRDLKRLAYNTFESFKGTVIAPAFNIDEANKIIDKLPKPEPTKTVQILPTPELLTVDESGLIEINQQIAALDIQKVRYDNYLKESAREDEKMKLTGELKELTEKIRVMRIEKAHKQSNINGIIEGLEYKDFQLRYENTTFEMLSTSQLMKLSSLLSSLYTDSFGLELIDRGESMGKSIFGLIEKAEKEDKNILVTIVGEKPANIPDKVGVFVVENGEIK